MEKRNVLDKRAVKLDHVLADDYIPWKGGRPNRQQVIAKEDIVNLKIALNTSSSLQQLIEKI